MRHKEIFDLLHHIRKHAEKGAISQEDVSKMASVAKRKHRRRAVHRGQRPELKLNWCSYEGCQGVTHPLRSHLQHKHRARSGKLLDTYVRVAREYRGKIEADNLGRYMKRVKRRNGQQCPQTSQTPHQQRPWKNMRDHPPPLHQRKTKMRMTILEWSTPCRRISSPRQTQRPIGTGG